MLHEIKIRARTENDFEIIESCTLKPPALEVNAAIKNISKKKKKKSRDKNIYLVIMQESLSAF